MDSLNNFKRLKGVAFHGPASCSPIPGRPRLLAADILSTFLVSRPAQAGFDSREN